MFGIPLTYTVNEFLNSDISSDDNVMKDNLIISSYRRTEKFYHRKYIKFEIRATTNKRYIGLPGGPCIFCGRSDPDTTFDNASHTIPEGFGNRGLLAADECDQCNEATSSYENDLMNFSSIDRAILSTRGKRGYVKYKSPNGGIEIYTPSNSGRTGDPGIAILSPVDPLDLFDPGTSTVEFAIPRISFRPRAMYKAILKICLSTMPRKLVNPLRETYRWLSVPDLDSPPWLHESRMNCWIIQYKNHLVLPRVKLFISKRPSGFSGKLNAFAVLQFGNIQYQIEIPDLSPEARHREPQAHFSPYIDPDLFEEEVRTGHVIARKMNLSEATKRLIEDKYTIYCEIVEK